MPAKTKDDKTQAEDMQPKEAFLRRYFFPPPEPEKAPSPGGLRTLLVLGYVFVVLGADLLATLGVSWPFSWGVLRWAPHVLYQQGIALGLSESFLAFLKSPLIAQFDCFKFLFWFLIPFSCCLYAMDWRWIGFQRWKRRDYVLLGLLVIGAIGVILAIPLFPDLRSYYPSRKALPFAAKLGILSRVSLWTFSWFLGWEFLHRYLLLRQVNARWPRWGWLLVPLSETLYHLTKPPLEALGMGIFSLLATSWTRYRGSMMLAFLVHLVIEMALWLFLLFV